MKVIASGVANCAAIVRSPSFSRSAASTTTTSLPVRTSAIASSIVAKAVAREVVSIGRIVLVPLQVMPSGFWVASIKPGATLARGQGWLPWQGRGWFLAPRDRGPETDMDCLEGQWSAWRQPFDVLREHVDLEVDGRSGAQRAERRHGERVRDQRELNGVVAERGDRQRDAIDGQRALLGAVAQKLLRDVEREAGAVALRLERANPADAVHVALDVVAAERLAGPERGLEVDLGAFGELAEGRAREGLGDGVEGELAFVGRDGGQAASRDGDRVADARPFS